MNDLGDRFWSKVEKTEGCWNWIAAKDTAAGYGLFRVDGRLRKAHRLAHEMLVGPIPDGMLIDHMCYNKSCVNPTHLRVVTQKQNMENRPGPPADNTSGALGVTWNKRLGKWHAYVRHNYKRHHVGYFTDVAEAKNAVIDKRNQLFTHNYMDRNEHQ